MTTDSNRENRPILCKPFRAEDLFAILERLAGLRFLPSGERPTPRPALAPDALAERLAAAPAHWRADLRVAVVRLPDPVRRHEILRRPRLRPRAPGLTACSALEKFAAIQMVEVRLPALGRAGQWYWSRRASD